MAIKFSHVNKADVVRILFGQIYSLTVEQQPCLGFVPAVINMHPGLCFPSGQCPCACLCVRLQARESAVCWERQSWAAVLESHGPADCVELRDSEQPNLGEQHVQSLQVAGTEPLCRDDHKDNARRGFCLH